MKNCMCSVVVAEVQEVQAHPQKFWFGENPCKIPENPGKIRGNLGKICENLRKIPENLCKVPRNTIKNGAQRALIWKNGAQRALLWKKWDPTCIDLIKLVHKITWRSFLEVIRKNILHEKYSHKKWPKIFLGKFGEIRAKILRTPKKLPAPTPMCRPMWSVKSVATTKLVCYSARLNYNRQPIHR